MRILLDKGFIRRALEGFVRVANQQPLTEEQKIVLEHLRSYLGREKLYMSYKSFHTLTYRFGHLALVQKIFFANCTALSHKICPPLGAAVEKIWFWPGRRVHDQHGFILHR